MTDLKVIAFDADDTLWVNEPFFQETEQRFCDLLEAFLPRHTISRELLTTEIDNLKHYGYGIKSFILSMIETAIRVSGKTISVEVIEKIITLGKEMLDHPIELIDGVEEVLQALQGKYRLVMATKGDLLDQEKKLIKSGLAAYFHHTEIVSEKKEPEYQKLIKHLDIQPHQFLMIGNSLKSDILPVLNLGGYGFHVPFHTTWAYEQVEITIDNPNFRQLTSIREVLEHLP
ncbi:MAG: HAD family hydrolase [Saprospiraceae bacterium]